MIGDQDLERYSRQLLVPDFDFDAQQALGNATVLIVGCGGLGCPVALYLAAAGVGNLRLVDDDKIERSNLPRQIAYAEHDVGKYKADLLCAALQARNSAVTVESVTERFNDETASELLKGVQMVIDGSDSRATRALIDSYTARLGLPWVMGAAVQMSGQNMVFDAMREHGCYHCIAPEHTDVGGSCAELGILGPVVGAVAMTQALDAIKLLSGCAQPAFGLLRIRDFRRDESYHLSVEKRGDCAVCGEQK